MQHSFGWPLDNRTGGGSFLYHMEDDIVSVGYVVHLNYDNPTLSPFDEFQRFKTHPMIAPVFRGRQAHRLRRARDLRRRLAERAQALLPRRRAARLLGGLRQRAAREGFAQRDPVRHARGRMRREGARRGPRQRRTDRVRGELARQRCGPRSQARAQRQAAVVEVRHVARRDAGRARHVDEHAVALLASSARWATASPTTRASSRCRR